MSTENTTTKCKDLIYDVGMHKGEDTDYYLQKGFRVIGFEANPDLVEHCNKRFAAAIESKQLTIVAGAIAQAAPADAGEQIVKFYRNVEDSTWGTISDAWARRNEHLGTRNEIIEVRSVNFSDTLRRYGIPYYMKIDIEGADIVCLKALVNFEYKPDYLSIESEKVSFNRLKEEIRILERLGYTSFKTIQQATITRQVEPSSSKEGDCSGYKFPYGSSGLFGKNLPGKWRGKRMTIIKYAAIFVLYRLFGDSGVLNRYKLGRQLRLSLERTLGREMPGWYDTHARLAS